MYEHIRGTKRISKTHPFKNLGEESVGSLIYRWCYHHPAFRTESGLLKTISLIILADLVYWHRPKEIQETDGEGKQIVVGYQNKFEGELLHRSTFYWEKEFGITKSQLEEGVKWLTKIGLIKRVLGFERNKKTRAAGTNKTFYTLDMDKFNEMKEEVKGYKKAQRKEKNDRGVGCINSGQVTGKFPCHPGLEESAKVTETTKNSGSSNFLEEPQTIRIKNNSNQDSSLILKDENHTFGKTSDMDSAITESIFKDEKKPGLMKFSTNKPSLGERLKKKMHLRPIKQPAYANGLCCMRAYQIIEHWNAYGVPRLQLPDTFNKRDDGRGYDYGSATRKFADTVRSINEVLKGKYAAYTKNGYEQRVFSVDEILLAMDRFHQARTDPDVEPISKGWMKRQSLKEFFYNVRAEHNRSQFQRYLQEGPVLLAVKIAKSRERYPDYTKALTRAYAEQEVAVGEASAKYRYNNEIRPFEDEEKLYLIRGSNRLGLIASRYKGAYTHALGPNRMRPIDWARAVVDALKDRYGGEISVDMVGVPWLYKDILPNYFLKVYGVPLNVK